MIISPCTIPTLNVCTKSSCSVISQTTTETELGDTRTQTGGTLCRTHPGQEALLDIEHC